MLPATHAHVFHKALAVLVLGLLVGVSYFPATMAGFVWDDLAFTAARPVQNLSGLWQIWFAPGNITNEGHYWPVLYSLFWLEHKLWGFAPAGYHIVNMLLHLIVTLLLWRLLLRLEVAGAWVAAAVFAVHPLHVESVAWVIGRKDPLAAGFYLACVLTYIRFVEDGHWWRYSCALGLFGLGLLSKSVVVTLPASLLIWHWWKQGRVTGTDLGRALPFLAVGLGVTVVDWLSYKSLEHVVFDYSVIERGLIAARAWWFYISKLVWPSELAVIYPRWEVGTGGALAWGCVAATVTVAVLLWVSRHRTGRGPLAGALFFTVTLSPMLGFVDYGYMQFAFVADRYQYLAGAGVIAVLVGAAASGARRLPDTWRTIVPVVVTVVVVACLGTITWHQAAIYKDEGTFFRRVAALNPAARFAHYNLGREYQRQGRLEEALVAYRTEYRFARATPNDPARIGYAQLGMGAIAEMQGRFEDAETHYKSGSLYNEMAFHRLAGLWIRQERYHEAIDLYQTFIKRNPSNAGLYSDMGVALLKLKRYDEALRSFEQALALDPYLKNAQDNRATLLTFLKNNGE
ncbi:MAG: tetratricopeptide repeat protein [Nitrospira sp.]|nr:tetratricopeptide repeat protein [Nitrospira sp.]